MIRSAAGQIGDWWRHSQYTLILLLSPLQETNQLVLLQPRHSRQHPGQPRDKGYTHFSAGVQVADRKLVQNLRLKSKNICFIVFLYIHIYMYKIVISVCQFICLFGCPSRTQKALNRLASNFEWGLKERQIDRKIDRQIDKLFKNHNY